MMGLIYLFASSLPTMTDAWCCVIEPVLILSMRASIDSNVVVSSPARIHLKMRGYCSANCENSVNIC